MRGITTGGKRRAIVAASTAIVLIGTLFQSAAPAGAAVATVVVNTTYWASTRADGTNPGGASSRPAVSTDGEYIAFVTTAPLSAIDTNGWADVYRKRTSDGAIDWVTEIGNGSSDSPYLTISDDGRYIGFSSDSSSFIGMTCEFCWIDTNNQTDIFRRDMSLPTNDINAFRRVNNGEDNVPSLSSQYWSMSADGQKFAFFSANGLAVEGGGTANPGTYIRDYSAATAHTRFVHEATAGQVAISGDGNVVVYQWDSPSVSAFAIYLTDLNDGAVSAYNLHYGLSGNNADPIGLLGPDSVSSDGNITVFWSDGDSYPSGPNAPRPRQVYAYDHAKRKAAAPFFEQIELMSRPSGSVVDAPGSEGNADSAGGPLYPKGAVSNDGNRLVFTTAASDVDVNAASGGLIIRERSSGQTGVMSVDAGGIPRPVVDGTVSPGGNVVGFSTIHAMVGADTNGANDVYARAMPAAPVPAGPGDINITLTNSVTSTLPGFSKLETEDVPATAIPLGSADEVSGAPLRSVDLATSPLRSVPLRSVPLRSVPLRSVPLRSVTLSQLPLRAGTWEALLDQLSPPVFKGVPLQSITLDAALAEFEKQAKTSVVDAAVTLENIDLASTPLRSVSLASIALGATPLRSVPLPGPGTAFQNWCALVQSLGFDCASLGLTETSPVLAADLAGVPLRSVPLRSVPLRSVPLRSVDLATSPLRSVPLRSVFLDGIPLGTLPLNKIGTLDASGNLAVSNPGLLVNCGAVDCAAGTLASAWSADAFLAGKTLGDLFDHVDLDDLPGSLAELIEGLVDTENFPWESIPLDGLQQFAGENKREVEYQVNFDVTGNQGSTATVAVQLPAGFQYKADSTVDPDLTDGSFTSPGIYGAPVVNGSTLTWSVPVTGGNFYDFTFRAFPGFDLATDATSLATLTVNAVSSSNGPEAAIDVLEDFEVAPILLTESTSCAFCDTYSIAAAPSFAPVIQPNTLIASHIGTSGDIDLFRVPVPPKGTRMQVHLGNRSQDADFDVAMLNTAADATPLRSVPLRSVPLRSVPLADNGVDASAADSALSPETLDDIPNLDSAPLRSVGENRGVADEFLATVSDADPTVNESQQYYTLQVTAYNGGSSISPYVLYVKTYAPPPAPECPAGGRVFEFAGQGTAGAAPTLPDGLNTLFLINKKRMGDTFGSAAADAAIAKLNSLAGQSSLGVTGAVYPVESDGAVATAMANWDASPCNTDLANSAFNAVGEVVDSVKSSHPSLKNIVVVGSDDIIPMARIADYTQISNESDYAAGALLGTGLGTPIAAAAANQNFLSDDPLADTDPIPWLDHTLFVPDMAIGRLVETPAEIGAQVDQFIAANGRLDPAKTLTTGYDFLADGANGVNAALANGPAAANRSTLINETWSKAQALAALFPAGGSPDIASVNAHYDHTKSLPALGNSTHDESDLVTTADIAAHPLTLTKRLLFTMGCHSGLSMPKAYTDNPADDADWAQTYGAQKAAVYLANTGFGYGDTAAVALSEELMRQFALRLNGSMTVGEAAVYAKQAYFGQLGAYGPYDEKVMQEAAFYGLPMWKIGDGNAPLPPAPAPIVPVDGNSDGVFSAPVSISSTFSQQFSKGGGSYFNAAATGLNVTGTGLQVTQYRPIEPRVTVDVTPVEGVGQPHGVLITDLESHDVATVPAVSRPVIDLTAAEPPPPAGDVSFPTSFDTLTTFNAPDGQRDQIVFMPGQFFRDASWANAGGVQRLFDDIDAEVQYSNSLDQFAPQLTDVEASLNAGQLTIDLTAYDESDGGVKRVVVLVKDGTGEWTLHDLTSPLNDNAWTVTFPVVGNDIEYFAQAVDDAGNVGKTTNKGKYFSGLPPALTSNGTPDLKLTPGQPTGNNGWYRGPVTATLSGTPGVSYTKSVDGGAPTAYTGPITLTGDGSHSVKAVGNDGSSDTVVAVIDTTAPTAPFTPSTPANSKGWYKTPVTFTSGCTDATSGVQVCPSGIPDEGAAQKATAFDFAGNAKQSAPFNIDLTPPTVTINIADGQIFNGVAPDPVCTTTDALSGAAGCVGSLANAATPGWYSYVAIGQDNAGNMTTKTITFKASYLFGGFQQPVNYTGHYQGNAPLPYSVFNGGSTVPMKFKLLKQNGTASVATATPTFLTPVRMGPLGGVPVNEPQVVTAPTPGNQFTLDSSSLTYSFNWKTDKKTMSGYYWKVGVLVDGQTFTVLIGLK
jgi:hypothetical protein